MPGPSVLCGGPGLQKANVKSKKKEGNAFLFSHNWNP